MSEDVDRSYERACLFQPVELYGRDEDMAVVVLFAVGACRVGPYQRERCRFDEQLGEGTLATPRRSNKNDGLRNVHTTEYIRISGSGDLPLGSLNPGALAGLVGPFVGQLVALVAVMAADPHQGGL